LRRNKLRLGTLDAGLSARKPRRRCGETGLGLVTFLIRGRIPCVQCRDALLKCRGQPMFGLGRALLRSGLRQCFLRGDRTGPRLPRVLRDVSGIQRDQHVTSSNLVAGLDAYTANRGDDSARDGCGFACSHDPAGFEPVGRVDRRHTSDGDGDRLCCLRLGPVLAAAAGRQPSRHHTKRDDSK
jgi:hypothetical protein